MKKALCVIGAVAVLTLGLLACNSPADHDNQQHAGIVYGYPDHAKLHNLIVEQCGDPERIERQERPTKEYLYHNTSGDSRA